MCFRVFLGLVLLAAAEFAMAVAEPPFTATIRDKPFELREYPGFIVAETFVDGDFDAAGRTGFRRIAKYIFGDNIAANGTATKVAMTAPVTMEPAGSNIAMTAPVTMEAQGARWRMHFVMPAGYTLAALPRPKDARITLREVPAQRVAAVRFSGFTTAAAMAEQTAKLTAWMQARGLKARGTPQIARYNDPFTLPWNRRNEMLIEVE
jgi:hypothetical protein